MHHSLLRFQPDDTQAVTVTVILLQVSLSVYTLRLAYRLSGHTQTPSRSELEFQVASATGSGLRVRLGHTASGTTESVTYSESGCRVTGPAVQQLADSDPGSESACHVTVRQPLGSRNNLNSDRHNLTTCHRASAGTIMPPGSSELQVATELAL